MNVFPRCFVVLACLLTVLGLAAPATAQEGEVEMSAEEQAMQETWMKGMTPGSHHEMLQGMAGDWKVSMKMWMEPGGEPMVSEATVTRKTELGGRVLEEHLQGSMMGQEFEGIGRTGYDNLKEEWWSTWTDNMSTGLFMMTGTWDEASKTMTWTGEGTDPMTGKSQKMKMVVVHEGADKETATMYQADASGEMNPTMEITYTR